MKKENLGNVNLAIETEAWMRRLSNDLVRDNHSCILYMQINDCKYTLHNNRAEGLRNPTMNRDEGYKILNKLDTVFREGMAKLANEYITELNNFITTQGLEV